MIENFRDMDLVEHIGSGMNRILKAYSRKIFELSENFLEVVFPFEANYSTAELSYIPVTPHVAGQVTGQVKKIVLSCENELSRNEIRSILNLKGRDNFEKLYLKPALEQKFIEMTISDKPNSRLQKYRLTEKGMVLKQELEGLTDE